MGMDEQEPMPSVAPFMAAQEGPGSQGTLGQLWAEGQGRGDASRG